MPTSTDNATAEDIEHNTDFDDVASVVSYASFVEVTEADAIDPAMTRYTILPFNTGATS